MHSPREATSTGVQDLRRENRNLKQVVAETVLRESRAQKICRPSARRTIRATDRGREARDPPPRRGLGSPIGHSSSSTLKGSTIPDPDRCSSRMAIELPNCDATAAAVHKACTAGPHAKHAPSAAPLRRADPAIVPCDRHRVELRRGSVRLRAWIARFSTTSAQTAGREPWAWLHNSKALFTKPDGSASGFVQSTLPG